MISGLCDRCGQPYETSYRRQKYCTARCRKAANREKKPATGPRAPPARLFCDYCGAPFATTRRSQKFCSAAHRRAFNEIVDRNARVVMRAVRESVREILRARGGHADPAREFNKPFGGA